MMLAVPTSIPSPIPLCSLARHHASSAMSMQNPVCPVQFSSRPRESCASDRRVPARTCPPFQKIDQARSESGGPFMVGGQLIWLRVIRGRNCTLMYRSYLIFQRCHYSTIGTYRVCWTCYKHVRCTNSKLRVLCTRDRSAKWTTVVLSTEARSYPNN